MFERPVVCTLCIRGKTTGGEFPGIQMILQAFATGAFPRTGLIGTVAILPVLIQLTIHCIPLHVTGKHDNNKESVLASVIS